ncbi:MAGa7180 family putative nuclease [Metamycoplasma gateae]|uniref:YqaJ viral recombinase domain-containing protein n=1 Tax=Metamycoplasma gateae TaxID=35769 RepID=A0ABZ2AIJ1_9BACT|nr:hypothetical protein V2E26_01215 [Metamycoplasma gateae]
MSDLKQIKIPVRYFYNGKQYFVDYDSKTIKLEENYHKKLLSIRPGQMGGFRKITGSSLGDILELTQFNSQFTAFTRLCNFRFPVLDPKYTNAGVAIEPKILEKIEKKYSFKIQRFNAEEYNYDYFKENLLFGGLPDGFLKEQNLVIEIKTVGAKKLDSWNQNNINISYIKQAQLYSYLIGAKKFTIVACFLEEEDYAQPSLVDIEKRVVKNWFFEVNEKQVLDDIKTCQEWFEKYTKLGISPEWKESTDIDIVKFLSCKNFDEWKELYLEWVKVGKAVPEYE